MKGQKNVVETSAHPPDPSPSVAHGHVAVYSPSAVTCGRATILLKVGRMMSTISVLARISPLQAIPYATFLLLGSSGS